MAADGFLRFDASIVQPNYEQIFLDAGGQINAAAARGKVDFCVTGSKVSYEHKLVSTDTVRVSIPLPQTHVQIEDSTATFNDRFKILVSVQRLGSGIQGSGVDTYAGNGFCYLVDAARQSESRGSLPVSVQYGNWKNLSAVVLISNVQISTLSKPSKEIFTDQEHTMLSANFMKDDSKEEILSLGCKIVENWANSAWDLRQKTVYNHSPNLTKTVARVNAGIADQGFILLHDVLDTEWPFTTDALSSLLENTIQTTFGLDADEIKAFESKASKPGIEAAQYGHTVCGALSIVANFLVAYRADGKTQIGSQGAVFGSTESWLRQSMRSPVEANDCDGSAILVNTILNTVKNTPSTDRMTHKYIGYVYNVMNPHYLWGVSVLGANAASADSATGGGRETVAGHAVALVFPVVTFLDAVAKGFSSATDNVPIVANDLIDVVTEARFKACYPQNVVETLEDSPEKNDVANRWVDAKSSSLLRGLQAFAIEGTTPASPILYIVDSESRSQAETNAHKDSLAHTQMNSHIARGIKILHVGGTNVSDPHRFYHDFVELTLHRDHPLFADKMLRQHEVAASQWVFAKYSTHGLSEAGVTPKEIATQDFAVAPLYTVGQETASILDKVSEYTSHDVMPPRFSTKTTPWTLSPFQSAQLRMSISHLNRLDEMLDKDSTDGHCIQFIFSYASLVHNPSAVQHFADRLSSEHGVAIAGMVDIHTIKGLAKHINGDEAGFFAVVNAIVDL